MSQWNCNKIETIEYGGNEKNCRSGEYYEYSKEIFDTIINDKQWRFKDDHYNEWEYIMDNLDKRLESNDGKLVFIPTGKVSMSIDAYYDLEDQKYE